MSQGYTPPPVTANLQVWAQNVVTYLQRTASRLSFKRGDARAVEDGVILWDEVNGYPVVSKSGEWRQVVLVSDVPSTASDSGVAGQIAFDASYIYVCTAADTWKRASLSTW